MIQTTKKQLRIFLPALMSVALFGVVVFWFILPQTRSIIMKNKLETIRELTHTACSILASYEQQVQAGILNRTEAEAYAISRIRQMRYGPEGKDYLLLGFVVLAAVLLVSGYIVLQGIMFEKERSRMERELRKLASTDPLTGALNRRHFWRLAGMELHRHQRYFRELAMLVMDIDHFKRINDTFGHPAGDTVLRELVKSCTSNLRKSDIFGRIGGEEFAVLLVETQAEAALEVADRLRQRLAEKKTTVDGGIPINFTVSIGVAHVRREDERLDDLIKRADAALYQAKNKGRNRVEASE
jgi:diguanylate cyclase (GGDEF)-like protein